MSELISALRYSVDRLHDIVQGLDAEDLERSAYPTEWTIANVLSHLGSGAVIFKRRLDDVVGRREPDDHFNQSVWDEWNAKRPAEQAADFLTADAAALAAIEAFDQEQWSEYRFAMGPMKLDFNQLIALRLNEHVIHGWDVEVVLDPSATLPFSVTGVVIDHLEMIARFSGRSPEEAMMVSVRTHEPTRCFMISISPDAVELHQVSELTDADLDIGAEAFIRLVYGRLDPEHTPEVSNEHLTSALRRVFKGI